MTGTWHPVYAFAAYVGLLTLVALAVLLTKVIGHAALFGPRRTAQWIAAGHRARLARARGISHRPADQRAAATRALTLVPTTFWTAQHGGDQVIPDATGHTYGPPGSSVLWASTDQPVIGPYYIDRAPTAEPTAYERHVTAALSRDYPTPGT